MADLLKFELTPNNKAVSMSTNDLIYVREVDYKNVKINLDNIVRIVNEENSNDGLNVTMVDGQVYTVLPHMVTQVGATAGTIPENLGLPGDPYLVFQDNDALESALISLIGW